MSTAWRPPSEPAVIGDPDRIVMLISGQSFCLSNDVGDVIDGAPHGWFVADRRVLSRCEMFVNGSPVDLLAIHRPEPYEALHVGRTAPAPDRSLLLLRRRSLDETLVEQLELRNHGNESKRCRVVVKAGADFADLFAVKDGRVAQVERVATEVGATLEYSWRHLDQRRRTSIAPADGMTCQVLHGRLVWDFTLAAGACATVGYVVSHELDSFTSAERTPRRSALSMRERTRSWDNGTARVLRATPLVRRVIDQSLEDLGSLRLVDSENPDQLVVVAGAPWFMTLFGRDSLLTSYMSMMFDHSIARGCVNALARLQGDRVDDAADEDPGKILHELRFADASSFSLADGTPYYGSVDATPLFVMMVGELVRWGAIDTSELRNLRPAVDRALEWIDAYGDRDGDGFVEYLVRAPDGLVNQGWKDSHDGIRYADGRVAEAPIALAEVQAYVYDAFRSRAVIAAALDEGEAAVAGWNERATNLADRFDEAFWLGDDRGYAVGLDADKQPIDSITSNMGHCLWTGIARPHRSAAVAAILLSDPMWSGWGIRTLSSDNPAYDPLSYHCGSVWPHDSAIAAAGLMRYGHAEEALRIAAAVFEAADMFDGRLPELISGLSRDEIPVPVRYPTSCSPQAWAAASPLYMLQMMIGFGPDLAQDRLTLNPMLPEWLPNLVVNNIPLRRHLVNVRLDSGRVEVVGLPQGLEVLGSVTEMAKDDDELSVTLTYGTR